MENININNFDKKNKINEISEINISKHGILNM